MFKENGVNSWTVKYHPRLLIVCRLHLPSPLLRSSSIGGVPTMTPLPMERPTLDPKPAVV